MEVNLMQRDLAVSILETFKNKYSDKYEIQALGLFGSVARNEATSTSDVDICIKTKNADLFAMVHIKEELEKLFSTSIDIVRIRDKMNPFLKNRIEEDAIYV